jgi:tRNA A37 threonylcarbamoyladenosine modification protein TsaB
MKLSIDTSSNQQTVVRLGTRELVKDSSVWRSQVVLPMIKELLGNGDFKEITEIEVNPGPGSFTGLRVGVAIANALGFALGVPVNGKDVSQLDLIEPVYD